MTIRDLLCHRSGLPDHEGDLLEDLGYGRAEVLRRLRFVKLEGFRSHYAYTNFGFTEAAVAAARAAGKDWEDLAADRLFRLLGMKSSSYRHADYAAAANRAHLHVREGDRWVARHDRQPDAQSPAGGASSSARDMAQWLRLLLAGGKVGGKQVVAAKALAETHRPQIVSHQPANASADRAGLYGLGWNVSYDDNRVRLSHSGGFALGAATVVALLPGEGLGIVVLTNGAPIGVPEAVSASFFDLVLKGKAETDWFARYRPLFDAMAKPAYGTAIDYAKPPARPTPALPAEAYIGNYHNDYFGTIEVVAKGKGVALRMGPKRAEYALRHWDRDVYTYQPPGENAGGPSGVTFLVGPGGKTGRVVVENLDVRGQGAFVRSSAKK